MNFFTLFKRDNIGEPPWEYNFLLNLEEKEYPKYLKKIFEVNTGENLPLKYDFKRHFWLIDKYKCKTLNQKIQYLKLYDATKLKCDCTDKVKVREFVKDKIGAEYLKPVFKVCNNFDEIDFKLLPNSFIIKCNHGCKWNLIIKNKEELLETHYLFNYVKNKINGWLEQDYSLWSGFEMQYHKIHPQIVIEKLLLENINKEKDEQNISIYCFNGQPFIIRKYYGSTENSISIWNEKLEVIEDIFNSIEDKIDIEADLNVKKAKNLSEVLAKYFNFVRIDWMLYKNKIYFEELTFTPYSGFRKICNKKLSIKLGNLINLDWSHHGF